MKYEYFSQTPQEHAETLTRQLRCTLDYLSNTGYITEEQRHRLATKLIVTPIRNNKSILQRVRDRFFSSDQGDDCYVFAIVELPESEVVTMLDGGDDGDE